MKKISMLFALCALLFIGDASAVTSSARPGSVTGAVMANSQRKIAMPLPPGVNTNINTSNNAPGNAVIPSQPPVTGPDYCRPPFFDLARCCAQPNPPAHICAEKPIDYCSQQYFNRDRCCAQPNPPAHICTEKPVDYCTQSHFDYDKCCAQPNPPAHICQTKPIDYCTQPHFDYDKCCAQPNPPASICNECGDIIPSLGVDICVARRACTSIWADNHQAIFDEDTLQCLIPAVAHNWSGVIKVSGQDLMVYVPMGEIFKCGNESFEQVRYMRRTSQWVVPVMIVGGAGIGAGIGAIIDANQKAKQEAADKAQREAWAQAAAQSANQQIADQMRNNDPSVTGYIVKLENNKYDLKKQDSGQDSSGNYGRPDFIRDLNLEGLANGNDQQIKDYITEIETLVQILFQELVSTHVCGQPKLGRIKITADQGGCYENGGDDRLFCHYDQIHVSKTGDEIWSDCHTTRLSGGSMDLSESQIFYSTGQCFYRDEITASRQDAGQYQRGHANVSAYSYDTTVSADRERAKILTEFQTALQNEDNPIFTTLKTKIGYIYDKSNVGNLNIGDFTDEQGNVLDYILVSTQVGFGSVIARQNDYCGAKDTAIIKADDTIKKLYDRLGGLQILRELVTSDPQDVDTKLLDEALANVTAAIEFNNKISVSISPDLFQSPAAKKRPFFQTSTGRGLLIGAGVGTLAGLGYWFAEGASTWCNVGGLEQVKLAKYWSIPTLREYIVRGNYIQ